MTPSDVDQTVPQIVERLRLLDPNGERSMVDSLSVIDVVQALETALTVPDRDERPRDGLFQVGRDAAGLRARSRARRV